MKRFIFAYAPVLEVREREEREAAIELAAAMHATAAERAHAAELHAERVAIGRSFAATNAPPDDLRAGFCRLELLAPAIVQQERAIAAALETETAARDVYDRARRERARIEALRDRARAAYDAELDARDARAMDESNANNSTIARATSFHIS